MDIKQLNSSLNPRFDGAFLIQAWRECIKRSNGVLIPDLMGLFWFEIVYPRHTVGCVLIPDLMGLFWFSQPHHYGRNAWVLIPDLMGLFWFPQQPPIQQADVLILDLMGLFWFVLFYLIVIARLVLIPDLMGLFWFKETKWKWNYPYRLNPRFDGAFLIRLRLSRCRVRPVLIPDLMGLFWFNQTHQNQWR